MPAKSVTRCLALAVYSCSLGSLNCSAMIVEFGPGYTIVPMWRESRVNKSCSYDK